MPLRPHARWDEFVARHPAYAATAALDQLRATELTRLDRDGQVYLDTTGGSLYADCQVRGHAELLLGRVLGNPHSLNPASAASTELVERSRRRVLDFFSASPDEYVLVFTANASHALKLVGESYPFAAGDRFLLTFDNHNSVNGIREFDRARGAETTYVPVLPPDLRVDEETLGRELERVRPGHHHLFAYPAQSNFSGVQHPLEWIDRARGRGWDVLLDAAAYVPTNRLDLSRHHPDFVALSFYKIFGYPTGVGALIARREALARLHRPWFAGGTIAVASVQADQFALAEGAAAFEDGTPDFTSIPAIAIGLDLVESIGVETIHQRVIDLTGWLIDGLVALRHASGLPVVKVYGPTSTAARGGTVTMNFFDPEGRFVDHALIEARAAHRNISLRTGCFCNPGAGEMALGIEKGEIVSCFRRSAGHLTYEDFRRCIDGKSTGAVRVSVGWVSNFADIEAFLDFARDLVDRPAAELAAAEGATGLTAVRGTS
jgi:molybdenum cofactor sulfurtransferase